MLPLEHSAILLTCIKQPFVIKTFVCLFLSGCFTQGLHYTLLTGHPNVSFPYEQEIYMYRKCSKILNTFLILFSNKMLMFRAGIYKILVRIANRGDPDQIKKQSDLGLRCLSRPFKQAAGVRNFRTFTILT